MENCLQNDRIILLFNVKRFGFVVFDSFLFTDIVSEKAVRLPQRRAQVDEDRQSQQRPEPNW